MNKNLTIEEKGLKEYLMSLKLNEIQCEWRETPVIKLHHATTRDEIEIFKIDETTIPKETIIEYNKPFLVDALGNDLSIVILTRKKYKINGRLVNAKFVTTIIEDCRSLYGTPLNGYWVIPEQFITSKK
jgi:hypothetical protein